MKKGREHEKGVKGGKKERGGRNEGPERRIDSVRNTRFQLLGYHFIKPGLQLSLVPAESSGEAAMSPLTNDERWTRLHTGRFRSSLPSFLFLPLFLSPSSLSVSETLWRLFEELVNLFFFFLSHVISGQRTFQAC